MTSTFSTNESVSLERDVDLKHNVASIENIWNGQEAERCRDWILQNNFSKVCLQFPDDLLSYSTEISRQLTCACNATSEIFILGDTSYGSCCVDEIAASHIKSEAIIHFGHACLSKVSRLPVLYVFLKLNFDVAQFTAAAGDKLLASSTEPVKIFYDTAYYHCIETIVAAVESSYANVEVEQLAIKCESDVLCWKIKNLDFSMCSCIYIGQDNQSFFNLSTSIQAKWSIYDPISNVLKEVSPLTTNWMKKRYFYIEKCKDARTIGIVVGTLTNDGYLNIVKHIQNLTKKHCMRSYIISVGKINPAKLANFMDIDIFVLVGCPENTIYNSRDFFKPLITAFELEMALNPAWHLQLPETYCSDFKELLPAGKLYRNAEGLDIVENDVSLVSGRVRFVFNKDQEEMAMDTNGTRELQVRGHNDMALVSSSDAFSERNWQGLDPAMGKHDPAVIEMGRSGLPLQYAENPTN